MDYLPSNSSSTFMKIARELEIEKQAKWKHPWTNGTWSSSSVEQNDSSISTQEVMRNCSSSQKLRHRGSVSHLPGQHSTKCQVMHSPSVLIQNTQNLMFRLPNWRTKATKQLTRIFKHSEKFLSQRRKKKDLQWGSFLWGNCQGLQELLHLSSCFKCKAHFLDFIFFDNIHVGGCRCVYTSCSKKIQHTLYSSWEENKGLYVFVRYWEAFSYYSEKHYERIRIVHKEFSDNFTTWQVCLLWMTPKCTLKHVGKEHRIVLALRWEKAASCKLLHSLHFLSFYRARTMALAPMS